MASLLILTAGGHGQVVGETAACAGYEKIGFLDDFKEIGVGKVIGGTGDVDRFLDSGEFDAVFPALGNNSARQKWMREHEELVRGRGVMPALVHPTAWVSPSAKLGSGVIVEAMAVVNANVIVGQGAIIGIGVKVDHDAVIGECAHLDAGAIVHARGKVNDLAKVEAGTVVGE
ncbi:MAG: hypothetical protein PUB52_10075 [Lachnospiraceae bacterium]|nr:hypothetical protein [Lachnospiraceae bacterium]